MHCAWPFSRYSLNRKSIKVKIIAAEFLEALSNLMLHFYVFPKINLNTEFVFSG